MKSAVIYARYSSHHQREVSIDDQVQVCRDYCAREGIQVVRVYSDAAMTGTTDARPDFQRMIANAPESDFVVVYQMDRFSRNQYDAPVYKRELLMRGVKLLSATERIPDTPEGVFMEKLLEGQAAYYSMNLSRSVLRGMNSNAEKCLANGVHLYGYSIDDGGRYVIDPAEAANVRETFLRYINGESVRAIAGELANRGARTRHGNPASVSFVTSMLHNEKYAGVYSWGDVRVVDGMPAIVEPELFAQAQKVVHKKVRANEEFAVYLLTGKLYCGICGVAMHGECAHGRSAKYHYYCCQRSKNCSGRNVRQEFIEEAVCEAVAAVVTDDEVAGSIAEAFVAQYGGGDTGAALKANAQKLRENKKASQRIGDAIEKGIEVPDVKERLARLKEERLALEGERGRLKAEEKGIDAATVKAFLTQGLGTLTPAELVDCFVNRVYLFEDMAVVTMNFKGETNDLAEVRFALDELERGDIRFELDVFGGPERSLPEPARIIPLRNAIGLVLPLAA